MTNQMQGYGLNLKQSMLQRRLSFRPTFGAQCDLEIYNKIAEAIPPTLTSSLPTEWWLYRLVWSESRRSHYIIIAVDSRPFCVRFFEADLICLLGDEDKLYKLETPRWLEEGSRVLIQPHYAGDFSVVQWFNSPSGQYFGVIMSGPNINAAQTQTELPLLSVLGGYYWINLRNIHRGIEWYLWHDR